MGVDAASDLPDLPTDAPQHIVSVTLRTPLRRVSGVHSGLVE
jgi:hypothetical protein